MRGGEVDLNNISFKMSQKNIFVVLYYYWIHFCEFNMPSYWLPNLKSFEIGRSLILDVFEITFVSFTIIFLADEKPHNNERKMKFVKVISKYLDSQNYILSFHLFNDNKTTYSIAKNYPNCSESLRIFQTIFARRC